MPAWKTSSLVASDMDHNSMRHSNSLMKNLPTRLSKSDIVTSKMFGSNRGKHGKSLKIGKTFKKVGKGIMKGAATPKMHKTGGISPSLGEFDKMMKNVVSKGSKMGSGKSVFNRKFFG